ncbi:MAG: hypothetical protein QXK88_08640 [Desulfurococcaceae archaeon]
MSADDTTLAPVMEARTVTVDLTSRTLFEGSMISKTRIITIIAVILPLST